MTSTFNSNFATKGATNIGNGRVTEYSATDTSPYVHYDTKNQKLIITGNSFRKDAEEFYQPIVDLVYQALAESRTATVEFNLDSFGPRTAKVLFKFFENLKYFKVKNRATRIIWRYEAKNQAMEELGSAFAELFDLPIEMKPIY